MYKPIIVETVLKKITVISLFLLLLLSIEAQDNAIDLSLQFHDKRIYFPETPIQFKVTITNQGREPYRFFLADNRNFNLEFQAVTPTRKRLEQSAQYIIDHSSNQQIYYREILLNPGEEFSFIEELHDYLTIEEEGIYFVKATFAPNMNAPSDVLTSNQLNVFVRPSVGLSVMQAQIDSETGEILRQADLSPDEVIHYTLTARQQDYWEKFTLYLNIEALMLKNPDRKREYMASSSEDRRRMIARYKELMKQEMVESPIITDPADFEIIKTSYTATEATVQVMQKFMYPDFTEIKRYVYYLEKINGIWQIYNYEVTNLGTE